MVELAFWKVQACGNDFVMVDDRSGLLGIDTYSALARKLCDRKFGIGADGIIFITEEPGFDFKMNYFNSDGSGPVMCGNGGRASVFFVVESGILDKREFSFLSSDGSHEGIYNEEGILITVKGGVARKKFFRGMEMYFVDTGVPHIVVAVNNIDQIDVNHFARPVREEFDANINLVEKTGNGVWKIRTFERGIEGETLSCGTGSVASAIVISDAWGGSFPVKLKARGGNIEVRFDGKCYWLGGDVKKVFTGKINL